ncbi:hypothetical protein EG19_12400 [Thermoanaerobaculum aquaticum]|uniref:4Fe-4S ferredoxin-type domain-containing protein n=1 Tax=Thermoanaerobaculum aquaticum TaxID=1312852 RepID=A0A062Y1K6_9BACT|nr:4Fe-4S dicluster domain-containing protein [Thermoanaerobaculum aquaticum]KDA54276.1 hypothetical protein EG19_12400 [Thermoanaerobaculum aquaticum]
MNRRTFLTLAASAAAAAASRTAGAVTFQREEREEQEFVGVLMDTTRCIGCRQCEVACAEVNDLPVPKPAEDNGLAERRDTTPDRFTVVNAYETEKGKVFVKKQCLHCWQPACAAACPTNAMEKTPQGPVIWHPDRCLGCRYCMLACPFEIPRFEYFSANPRIRKCTMCFSRLEEGKIPACVAACPMDALQFGKKRELMEIARSRIYQNPDSYVHHIYGEFEAGGTGWLYLSSVPFEQLGFRTDLGTMTFPDYTREFLYAVPLVLLGLPTLLYGLSEMTKKKGGE